MKLTELETRLLTKLPDRLYTAIHNEIALHKGVLQEIRLRVKQYLAISIHGRTIQLNIQCTEDDLEETLDNLCCNSLYSHAETIREGYIYIEGGIRAGVCGRAVTEEGRITAVRDLQYICIRIPHRFPGAADTLFSLMEKNRFCDNVLIYGKPGSGKTTILRELIMKLSECDAPKKVAVIDTRFELTADLPIRGMVDILSGYPRSQGILTAVRVLSPEYILCDEIMTTEDWAAIRTCMGSGVYVCASVHASSFDELKQNNSVSDIVNCFGIFYESLISHNEIMETSHVT